MTNLGSVCVVAAAKSLQSCPTLHDLIDGRPPGSPVPGIHVCEPVKIGSRGLGLFFQLYHLPSLGLGASSFCGLTFSFLPV